MLTFRKSKGGGIVAKSKWDDVKQKLILIQGWARNGLNEKQIAHNLGISKATFENYKKEHLDFLDSLKKGKEVVDIEVENALLKRAMGYEYEEVTRERVVKKDKYGQTMIDIHGLPVHEMVVTKVVKKDVIPDTTAQIFWLKNRKPEDWRDVNKIEANIKGDVKIEKEEKYNIIQEIITNPEATKRIEDNFRQRFRDSISTGKV